MKTKSVYLTIGGGEDAMVAMSPPMCTPVGLGYGQLQLLFFLPMVVFNFRLLLIEQKALGEGKCVVWFGVDVHKWNGKGVIYTEPEPTAIHVTLFCLLWLI